jgi:hypothetical protein
MGRGAKETVFLREDRCFFTLDAAVKIGAGIDEGTRSLTFEAVET